MEPAASLRALPTGTSCSSDVLLIRHGVVLGLRDMCAFMLLLTVHGIVSELRDMYFYVTLDCAWRCLMTS